MLQVFVTSDALQLVLDNQLDILLDLVVIVQNSLLHAVVAIRIQEIVDDGEFLITTFLSLYLVVDTDKVKREESHYQPIPIINDFLDADGNDCMEQTIQDNYNQVKEDVKQIVKDELGRIANDENLKHLIQKA